MSRTLPGTGTTGSSTRTSAGARSPSASSPSSSTTRSSRCRRSTTSTTLEFEHTLHSVRDGFAINYGAAGVGAEVIANRFGVGPMGDCIECKYEEFFLTSWAVGHPRWS